MVPYAVEDQIIMLPTVGEVFFGVINDVVRAKGSDYIHIPCAAYASDLCAK
jgi:hypothetical protein